MKSVLIITELFEIGGLETHIAGEIACLENAGIRTHLATGSSNNEALSSLKATSVTTDLKFGPTITTQELEETVERLRDIIHQKKIDCIHAHPFTSLIPALISAELEKIPFIVTLHGPASLAPCYGPIYEFILSTQILGTADLVLAVSPETADLASPYVEDERLLILPNAISDEYHGDTAQTQADNRWLLVSRLDAQKIVGIFEFIQYSSQAQMKGVIIAGDGEARKTLEEQVKQANLDNFVEFIGAKTKIPGLMRNAAGIAGMGRVALEGMASGKPVMLVGYDGVKGLLTQQNYHNAAHANFSGRNLPSIEKEKFIQQIKSLPTETHELAIITKQQHGEKSVWAKFIQQASILKYHTRSALTNAYLNLMPERKEETEELLKSETWIKIIGRSIYSTRYFKNSTASNYEFLTKNYMELKEKHLKEQIKEKEKEIETLNKKTKTQEEELERIKEKIKKDFEYITERNKLIEELKKEADSLFFKLNQIKNSNSWKITKPLRGAIKFVKTIKQKAGPEAYELSKRIGKTLPISLDTKIKIKKILQKYAFARDERIFSSVAAPNRFSDLPPRGGPIRPSVCGLEPELVSVILPVYNQADLIKESIDSVLAQTYPNFELIIINDGSSDGLEQVVEPYLTNPKIRIYHQANQKLPKALSNGFSFARGEFWTWTSADNIMEPLMLEKLVDKLTKSPDTGLVYADYYAIDDRGDILQDRSWRAHNRPNPASGEIRLPHSTHNLNTIQDNFIGPCFMYRGWIGQCIGDYDPQLGVEDYDYWMRINAFFQVDHLGSEELLYRYRVHDNTLSANAQEHRILDKVQGLMKYEQTRALYFHQPLCLQADAHMGSFLPELGFANDQVITLSSTHAADAVAIESSTLSENPRQFYDCERPLIILIDNPSFDYVKLKGLDPNRTLILANNLETTLRVRLITDCPVIDALSQDTGRAINVFCKARHYLETTRTKFDLQRHIPKQELPKNRPNILLQVDSFIQGGLENVVIDLAISLNSFGYNTSLAILGKEGDAAVKARELGLNIISFNQKPTPEQYLTVLREKKIGVVNAHYSTFGAKLCAQQKIPFIQTIHNSYVWLEPDAINTFQEADPYTTSYISVSATAARYAETALGLSLKKMRVIANGINPDAVNPDEHKLNRELLRRDWNISDGDVVYLNVASIMATKAQLPLITAFSSVIKTLPTARLVLLGDTLEPAYLRKLTDRIDELELQQHVILAGYNRSVAKFYHAADIFVLPSFWEGWSLSLGEAAANGLKCVITDVGSAYEFNDDRNVAIVPPPFGDITNLNWSNLSDYIHGEDKFFENRLSEAMINAAQQPKEKSLNYYSIFDRKNAYKKYALLFEDACMKTSSTDKN